MIVPTLSGAAGDVGRSFYYDKGNINVGEFAALATALFWALSSVFFTQAGKLVGSMTVNRIRLVFVVLMVLLAHGLVQGSPFPMDAGWERWFWLGLSGFVGLVLGDSLLFQAYVLVGNRLGTLLLSFAPVFGALIAWIFLGEMLSLGQIGGIVLTVSGIAVVVLEKRNGGETVHDLRRYLLGILCGLGGALGQAGGLVLAKKGLAGDFPALSAVAIRMLTSMIVIWILAIAQGQVRKTLATARNLPAMRSIVLGSFVGPFIGVWLSLVAVQATFVGIASTLNSLTPIFVLPIAKWGFKERVTLQAVIGTVIALAGVSLIFLIE